MDDLGVPPFKETPISPLAQPHITLAAGDVFAFAWYVTHDPRLECAQAVRGGEPALEDRPSQWRIWVFP